MSEATERPSRARSITQHDSSATASGWLSFTPAIEPVAGDHSRDGEEELRLVRRRQLHGPGHANRRSRGPPLDHGSKFERAGSTAS